MVNQVNQRIKDFWVNKINQLLTDYSLNPATLDEGTDWEDKLRARMKWTEIEPYGAAVCRDIYVKASRNVPKNIVTQAENYGILLTNAFKDLENEYVEVVEVMKTKIGVDPTDGNNIIDDGNPVPKWKYDINQKIYNEYCKLTDIPDEYDLADLLYRSKLYGEITTKLNNIIKGNLPQPNKVSYLNLSWDYKVDDAVLQNYNDRENQIKAALGRASTDAIPASWVNDTRTIVDFLVNTLGVDLDNLPTIPATEDLASLLARPTQTELDNVEDRKNDLEKGFKDILEIPATDALPNNFTDLSNLYKSKSGSKTVIQLKDQADKYQRIHTKLNGKVSDTELQALLDASPSCSHSDYDTIKSERDALKTENTQLKEHKCDCDSKVAQKETQIITKIITDLQLSTERERENVLEAVITEIKTKLAPPTDNSADKQKITELETKITNLQTPKSLTDLPISQEVKKEVIKISQELGLTAQSCAKLEKASSYQELSNLQKEAFQEKLNSEVSNKNSAETLNYCLGALTIGSLLLLAWMIIKQTKADLPKIDKEKK